MREISGVAVRYECCGYDSVRLRAESDTGMFPKLGFERIT
ncbi:hypothetical protein A2U01_0061478, partial [Trifolium medium]|nr:hypothetical protein [Trifolium medium]